MADTVIFRNGVPLLPLRPGAKPVTMEMVNRLRDEEYEDLLRRPENCVEPRDEERRK